MTVASRRKLLSRLHRLRWPTGKPAN